METDTKNIVFNLPENITSADIISQLLKSNGLEESDEEFFNKDAEGIEPRFVIVRDAVRTMVEKKIPDEELIGILSKHLEIKKEVAENIIKNIREKLIPFAKVVDSQEESGEPRKPKAKDEENRKEAFRKAKEELLRKIGKNIPTPEEKKAPLPYKKAPDITNVEANAKNMAEDKKIPVLQNEEQSIPQPKTATQTDPYKESIE